MGENLTDAEWLDILQLVSEHGFSAPHLRLARGEEVDIEDAVVKKLRRVPPWKSGGQAIPRPFPPTRGASVRRYKSGLPR